MGKEISAQSIRINRLILMVFEGQIKIPPLQRPFVWKVDSIIKLLESIYSDYPIGSILVWETNEKLPAARNVAGFKIPDKNPEYPHDYILDGQQRVSTLYGVFCNDRTVDTQNNGYEVNHDIFNILFDFKNECFIHKNDKITGEIYLEMNSLLDNVKFHKTIGGLSDNHKNMATVLQEAFLNYDIPMVVTKKRSREEIGIIFERINNSGTPLSLFDLLVAWTWTEEFHLKDKFYELMEILSRKNFDGIQEKVILQAISVILKESSKTKTITSLKPQEIRDNFSLLTESLKKTIDYFSTELCVKSIDLLPHSHQIVPLCYFFSRTNKITEEDRKAINNWFWKSSFSDRYSASTDAHIDDDVKSFKKIIEEKDYTAFNGLNYSITEEQVRLVKFTRTNPYSRAFIILMAHKNPLDLTSGAKIDVSEALSSFNKKEYHHIFPKEFLNRKGVSLQKTNSLCNYCLLPAASNKVISDKAPSDYFTNIIPKINLQNILESNLIPLKTDIYKDDDFELFLTERSRKIIEYIDSLLI